MQIPTDNLYKFIAVAGLLIFLGSGYILFDTDNKLHQVYLDIIDKSSLLIADVRYDRTHNNGTSRLDPKALNLRAEEIKAYVLKETLLEARHNGLKKVALQVASAGAAISILGFLLWYFKLQRYLDKRARKNWETEVSHSRD